MRAGPHGTEAPVVPLLPRRGPTRTLLDLPTLAACGRQRALDLRICAGEAFTTAIKFALCDTDSPRFCSRDALHRHPRPRISPPWALGSVVRSSKQKKREGSRQIASAPLSPQNAGIPPQGGWGSAGRARPSHSDPGHWRAGKIKLVKFDRGQLRPASRLAGSGVVRFGRLKSQWTASDGRNGLIACLAVTVVIVLIVRRSERRRQRALANGR